MLHVSWELKSIHFLQPATWIKHQRFFAMVPSKYFEKRWEEGCGLFLRDWKKQPDSCFVSHSRWTNASTHDNFQRKNWANYPWFKHPSCFYWQNKKRLGWVMTWWRFGLKKFGLNILKLIVIGLDMKIHCYHLMISLHIRLMESKLNYWKVILVVPRNANQWMLNLTNHSKPYWKGAG